MRRKKSKYASERDTQRVLALRQQHVEQVCTRPDVARFHFLDETGLRLDYARTHARAVGGQRVYAAVSLVRGGALSEQGLGAVQLLRGALNQRSFAFYLTQCLGPTLRAGDVLVLDNLAVHKLGGVREWLAERGGGTTVSAALFARLLARGTNLEQAQNQAAHLRCPLVRGIAAGRARGH